MLATTTTELGNILLYIRSYIESYKILQRLILLYILHTLFSLNSHTNFVSFIYFYLLW